MPISSRSRQPAGECCRALLQQVLPGNAGPEPSPLLDRGGSERPGPVVQQVPWAAVAHSLFHRPATRRRQRFPASVESAEASSALPVRARPSRSVPTKGRRTITSGVSCMRRRRPHPAEPSLAPPHPGHLARRSQASAANHRRAGDSPGQSAHPVNPDRPPDRHNRGRVADHFSRRRRQGRFP
jgi:hypothetical protein